MPHGKILFCLPGGEGEKRRRGGEEESRRGCQEEDDSVQSEFHGIQGDVFFPTIFLTHTTLKKNKQKNKNNNKVSSCRPADPDRAEETDGERKEEEDPK